MCSAECFLQIADETAEDYSKVPVGNSIADEEDGTTRHGSLNTWRYHVFVLRYIDKEIKVVIFCKDERFRNFIMSMHVENNRARGIWLKRRPFVKSGRMVLNDSVPAAHFSLGILATAL